MNQVWLWISRPDGGVERHLGPFRRTLRDKQTLKPVIGPDGDALADEDYAAKVHKALSPFDGQNAYDVAKSLRKKDLTKDETQALRALAGAFLEIAQRVIERQQRAEQQVMRVQIDGTLEQESGMRAPWLADFELASMTVHVRSE